MSKVDHLCSADHLAQTAHYADWAPQALKGFQALAGGAFAAGALSVREKEIIAFGCAHVLRCPYCIDYHHRLGTEAGATRAELTEALWVAIAVAAHAPFAHASIALRLLDGERPGDFYARDWRSPLVALTAATPGPMQGYEALQTAAFANGSVAASFKTLIAVACAHNMHCPLSIERYVMQALAEGSERPAIAEAVFVAIEMAAGACLGHAGLAAALMA